MGAPEPRFSDEAAGRLPADWHLAAFDHQPRTRLVFGPGSMNQVGGLVAALGASRVLVVTDPGIVRAGHTARVTDLLVAHRLEVAVFDGTRENPDTECVDECLEVARGFGPGAILGLGGGSAMDTAKATNFLLTNGGRMKDYWGVGKACLPMLPFVAVPTTAGTGSECQSAALIADAETHVKMACLDPKAAARVAILDPELTLSQPSRVTACTGIDAIAHALETAVTTRRNPISAMYAREAFGLLVTSFVRVMQFPGDLEARGRMLLGAAFAGSAIEASMLGAVHAAANPLTASYDLAHGVAVGLMLPHVVRFNALDPRVRRVYAELGALLPWSDTGGGPEDPLLALDRTILALLAAAGMPRSLRDAGVDPGSVPALAESATHQWTGKFNPRPVSQEDFAGLYSAALAGW